MLKKVLTISLIFLSFLLIFSTTFATNTDNAKNAISGVTNAVVDGVNNLSSDIRNSIGSAENGIEGAVNYEANNMDNTTRSNMSSNYSATRTGADLTTSTNTTMNSTLWIWIILAVLGVVIVALVWFYGTQQTNNHNDF